MRPVRAFVASASAPSRAAAAALAAVLSTLAPVEVRAQSWLTVEGIAVVEGWATDDGSRLLERNDGDPASLGRLTVWSAAELHPRLHAFVLAEMETGPGRAEEGTDATVEQVALRYMHSPGFVVEVGKILSPVGIFAARRFASVNPVVGFPDSYDVSYPWGATVQGRRGRLDYRAALVNLPVVNRKYLPEATARWRPAFGAGVTLATGFRIGASYTAGSYLDEASAPAIPAGSEWHDYGQRIVGFDARFSRGHTALRGELALSWYEVPTMDPIRGTAGYVEVQQTVSPRFFLASRLEGNDYAIIRLREGGVWWGRAVRFFNGEVAAGFRIGRDTLLKVSYRRDLWDVEEALKTILPNGYALALQLSQRFDVVDWFRRPL